MSDLTLENYCHQNKIELFFHAIWGSHAYGTNTPTSNQDTMGGICNG